jgi:hypothetical protein
MGAYRSAPTRVNAVKARWRAIPEGEPQFEEENGRQRPASAKVEEAV